MQMGGPAEREAVPARKVARTERETGTVPDWWLVRMRCQLANEESRKRAWRTGEGRVDVDAGLLWQQPRFK